MNWKEVERFAGFPPMEAVVEYRISQEEAKEILSLHSQCARFREKLDREKMAKVLYESHTRHSWQNVWNTHKGLLAMDVYRADADALIAYLTE